MIFKASIVGAVLLVLAAVAALLPNPRPTHGALTAQEAPRYCDAIHVYHVDAQVSHPGAERTVMLEWFDDAEYHIDGGYKATYQIERRADESDGADWETLDTVAGVQHWTGDAELGVWVYRVGIASLRVDDEVFDCSPQWAAIEVSVLARDELIEVELDQFCDAAGVHGLDARATDPGDGSDRMLVLEWHDELTELLLPHRSDLQYYVDLEEIHYRVERTAAPGGEGSTWHVLGKVVRTIEPLVPGPFNLFANLSEPAEWTGPLQPGEWVYRVGVVEIKGSGVVRECDNPYWAEIEITVLTEAERAELKARRAVLVAQAVRCATDSLTGNMDAAAHAVVGIFVEEQINEIIAGFDEQYHDETVRFRELVTLTILLCSDEPPGGRHAEGISWAMILLLDYDDYYRR